MTPARIPLLWIFLPFSIGITSGYLTSADFSFFYYYSGLAFVLSAFFLSLKWWTLLFSSGLFLSGFAYVTHSEQSRQIRADLPVREATATLEVSRLFESSPERVRGLATIVSIDRHLADLENAKVYLSLRPPGNEVFDQLPEIGSLISATAVFSPLHSGARREGFSTYLRNSGVSGTFDRGFVSNITHQPSFWRQSFNHLLVAANAALSHQIDADSPSARSYRAMLLGMKNELSDRQKDLFLESGALHLFAISGLHIGVIAACGHALFLFLRIPRVWIPIPNLVVIWLFVQVTGGAPSAWRALLMIACFYLCQSSKRQSASINALVLSATICLLINPLQLFLPGFQMSYATVASILLFGVPLGNRLSRFWKPFASLPKSFWSRWQKGVDFAGRFTLNSFAISFSAFLSSSALSIIYFNTLSTIGILINLILLPLASLVIIAGFISLLFAVIGLTSAMALFNHAAILVLWLMHSVLELINRFEATHLTFANPPIPLLFALLCFLLGTLLYSYNRLERIRMGWLFAIPLLYTGACLLAAAVV